MYKKDTIDWKLIRKKIDGKLSVTEQTSLDTWMKKALCRRRFVEQSEKYYSSDHVLIPDEKDIEKAWLRFNISHRNIFGVTQRSFKIASIAAAIVLLVSIGSIFKFSLLKPEKVEMAATEISPGANKACLILSDGRVIDLHQKGQGQIKDQQVDIKLDSSGISYGGGSVSGQTIHHTIRIPQGGEYFLTLNDGSRVWLNSQTELAYPAVFNGAERRVKLSGEAYFEVRKDESRPFIVETEQIHVKVLGTSFNINAYKDASHITTTLMTGKVELLQAMTALCTLYPDQQAVFRKADEVLEIKPVKTAVYSQWREGLFVFRDESLKEIMKTLARWYDMTYQFSDKVLEQERFYGTIGRYEKVEDLLRQFEKTGKIHFKYTGKQVIIEK